MRREATQSLTDGELFYVIENGIRLTGMPAWGAVGLKTPNRRGTLYTSFERCYG